MEDTVLIVEDEADVVDLLRYSLSKAGFAVLIASDGLKDLDLPKFVRSFSSLIPAPTSPVDRRLP